MTPFSSVAMLEKLALLKIAFCSAPVLSRAASRRTSVTTSTVPAASSEMAGSWYCADMSQPPSNLTPLAASSLRTAAAATGIQRRDRTLRPRHSSLRLWGQGKAGGGVRGSPEEPRVLAKRDGLCVLAQPVAEGFAVENDLLARILQVSLAPELIHVVSDDFARRTHILGEQFVGERRHADRAILLHRTQAFREADERAGQAACDVVHTETLDAVREIDGPLHEDLQQRHSQAGTLGDDVLDFGAGPGHQAGVLQSRGLLAAMRQIQQGGLAKELVGLIDVDHHLVAVVGQAGDFDFAFDDQEDVGGRLVLIVNHLAFLVLHNAGAGQMRERIFECFLRRKYRGAGCHFVSCNYVYFYFLSDWGVGAQVSLRVSILRTLNTGRVLPELDVPRTVTLWPTCLANPSVGKPSACRSATGFKFRSSTIM